MRTSPCHGFLVVDKPGGMTSRDVVDRALGWFPKGTKLGHTGTLDPLATGVLTLAVGVGTRLVEYVQDMDKTYRTRLVLGATSDTDDADGTIVARDVGRVPSQSDVSAALAGFVGVIDQAPPAYSAAKVDGRRAYALARGGAEVTLPPRPVRVYGIDLLSFAYPHLELEVRCGKGTYIRSLGRDLGEKLGCGAYVETLRRTRVGPFAAEDAVSLDASIEQALAKLQPLAAGLAGLPRVDVDTRAAARLRHGQSIPLTEDVSGSVGVFDKHGDPVGVAVADAVQRLLQPTKILPA